MQNDEVQLPNPLLHTLDNLYATQMLTIVSYYLINRSNIISNVEFM